MSMRPEECDRFYVQLPDGASEPFEDFEEATAFARENGVSEVIGERDGDRHDLIYTFPVLAQETPMPTTKPVKPDDCDHFYVRLTTDRHVPFRSFELARDYARAGGLREVTGFKEGNPTPFTFPVDIDYAEPEKGPAQMENPASVADRAKAANNRLQACARDGGDRAYLSRAVDLACELLSELGIREVFVHYSGSGDDGSIDEVTSDPSDVDLGEELEELIREIVYTALPGGWEINDGSEGTVTINPAAAPRLSFDHRSFYTEWRSEPFSID